MEVHSRNAIDLLISFLDYFIHPKILNSSNFILLRSRILVFWMLIFFAVILTTFQHLVGLVGPWHPLVLILDYCFLQVFTIIVALRFFGSYRVAFYVVMFSLYLNTPVAVTYSGGLHSASLIFYLFMPLAIFQLTKSVSTSMIGLFAGITEIFFIFYLHLSGWDFAGKGIIENYFPQLAGNILVTTIGIWIIVLIYSRSLAQVSVQIADAQRFRTIMELSTKMVREFEVPATDLVRLSGLLQTDTVSGDTKKHLQEINDIVFRLSSLVSGFRLDQVDKKKP